MSESSLFLYDNNKKHSYNELLENINNSQKIFQCSKFDYLFDYLSNMFKALINDKAITLLDNDFTKNEIEKIGVKNQILQTTSIGKNHLNSWSDLFYGIQNSNSEISIFTSGTTGVPKKVNHSIKSLNRLIKIEEKFQSKVWALAYNPTHIAGLQVIFQAFLNKNPLINIFNENLENIDALLNTYKVTHISSTPTFYRMIVVSKKKCSSIERCTSGGEKLDNNLSNKLKEKFPNSKINNIYASTEFGSLLVSDGETFKIPDQLNEYIKIVNHQLLVHKTLLASNINFEGEWYETGDFIKYVDDCENYFKISSRQSETINIGGYNVDSTEVENEILKLDGIQKARLYGRENSITGKILCAEIVANINIDESEIRNKLSQKLQNFKVPRIFKQVSDLSLTRTGKIKR